MKYIIDMSALKVSKEYYPPENATKFWNKLKDLNHEGKLVIINQIKEEINRGNETDYLKNDFVKNVIITNTEFPEIISILAKIGNEVQNDQKEGFRQWLKVADPYLIAYAFYLKEQGEEVMVVHAEVERGNKLKIDSICIKYQILHNRIFELVKREHIPLA